MATEHTPRGESSSIRSYVDLSATILVIVASCIFIWTQWPKGPRRLPVPTEPVSIENAATRGSSAAQVVVIEYSDFQCPACGQFARTAMPSFNKRYVESGQVLLAFKNLPLEQLHPLAFKAAEAAECSRRQGKFWEMHDRSFMNQQRLDEASLRSGAQALGLDIGQYDKCIADQASDRIRSDQTEARNLGLSSTPTFLIGSRAADGRVRISQRFSGAGGGDLERSIESLLAPSSQIVTIMTIAMATAGTVGLSIWLVRRGRLKQQRA